MDPITDVLSAVGVAGVCHGRMHITMPWGLRGEAEPSARFGMLFGQDGWLTVPGWAAPVHLASGDFFLLAPGLAWILQDELRTTPQNLTEFLEEKHGRGAGASTLIAGKLTFDEAHGRPLTDVLPPLIRIPAQQSEGLRKTLDLLVAESGASTPGSQVVVRRLADLLLIQALRAHIAAAPTAKTGWLYALSDPHIGAALHAMHERIEHPWTVASLASAAGMSRSAFAQRFKELVGDSPLEYLTRWRMHKASHVLRESNRKLVDVAQAVGYDSDIAFLKAFKRVLGVAPGEYRRAGVGRASVEAATASN